jgi:uncharacterized repeat protein (TIGR01451 family)
MGAHAAPSVTLSADKAKVGVGDEVTYTSTVNAGNDGAPATVWSMVIPPSLQVRGVRGPIKVVTQARLDYQNAAGVAYYVLSKPVTIRISQAQLATAPDASGLLVIDIGDMPAGDSETVSVTCERVQ